MLNVIAMPYGVNTGRIVGGIPSIRCGKRTFSIRPGGMDANGNFYGYLTVNITKRDRATGGLFDALYRFHEEIADDVAKWHDYLLE